MDAAKVIPIVLATVSTRWNQHTNKKHRLVDQNVEDEKDESNNT